MKKIYMTFLLLMIAIVSFAEDEVVKNGVRYNLLGKEVSFCYGLKEFTFQTDGTVTSIVFNLHGEHEFSVDDGGFYSFSEVLEFQVLDK